MISLSFFWDNVERIVLFRNKQKINHIHILPGELEHGMNTNVVYSLMNPILKCDTCILTFFRFSVIKKEHIVYIHDTRKYGKINLSFVNSDK